MNFLFSDFSMWKCVSITAVHFSYCNYQEAGAVIVRFTLHGRSQNAQNSPIGYLKLSYVVSAPIYLTYTLSLIKPRKPFSFFFFLRLQLSQICKCKILSKCKGSNSYQWNYDDPLFHHSLQLSFAVSKLCKRIFTLGWGESFPVVEDPTLGLSDARVKEIPIPTSKYDLVKTFCQKSRTEKSRVTCPKILSTKTNKSYSSPSLFLQKP